MWYPGKPPWTESCHGQEARESEQWEHSHDPPPVEEGRQAAKGASKVQPITKEELEKLIEEAKAAGKDTSHLEELLDQPAPLLEPKFGEIKKVGKRWIMSTGPARKEDFE